MLAAKREGVGIAANAAGVRAVTRRVEGQVAVAVVLGGVVRGFGYFVAPDGGDVAVDAAGIAAGEDLRPVVVSDAVRIVVIADAEVLEVFAGDGRVVVRAVAPSGDDAGGAAASVGTDVFGKRTAANEVGVIQRVLAVRAFVFDACALLGGDFLGTDSGVGGKAFVVGKGRQAFFGAQFVSGGKGCVEFCLGEGIGTGDGARRQGDVADVDVVDDVHRGDGFVVRAARRRHGFGIGGRGVVAAPTAAGGKKEQGEEADGGLWFHGFSREGCGRSWRRHHRI